VVIAAASEEHQRRSAPRQRRLFVAIVLNGVPVDALAIELDSNRNAIYKACSVRVVSCAKHWSLTAT
jgi:RNA polymerase sigma-70 factor (ECF subfamily)